MRVGVAALLALAMSSTSALATDWVTFTSKELGFSASFPDMPAAQIDTRKTTVDGKDYTFTAKQFSAKDKRGGAVCIVAHSIATWPIVVDEQLETSRDNMARGVGATVTTSKRTTVPRGTGSAPALLFDAVGRDYAFRALEVIDGETVYEIIGAVPIASGNDADLDRCVKGFALIAAK